MPVIAWCCENCGKEFRSEVAWIRIRFEDWLGYWLYDRRFNWKILGGAFLACVLFAAGGLYFASYLPEWFQILAVIATFMAVGAGFLLLREIPYAYPVYVVNWREPRRRRSKRRRE